MFYSIVANLIYNDRHGDLTQIPKRKGTAQSTEYQLIEIMDKKCLIEESPPIYNPVINKNNTKTRFKPKAQLYKFLGGFPFDSFLDFLPDRELATEGTAPKCFNANRVKDTIYSVNKINGQSNIMVPNWYAYIPLRVKFVPSELAGKPQIKKYFRPLRGNYEINQIVK